MSLSPKKRITLALVAVGAVALFFRFGQRESAISVTVVRATRGPIAEIVRATGHIEPEERIRVSARVTGDLATLSVQEGQAIKKGTLLGTVSPGAAQQQVTQRQAQLKSTQAQLRMEQAKVTLALRKLGVATDLNRRGLVSKSEIGDAEAEVRIARAQLQAASHKSEQSQAELAEEQARLGFTQIVAPADGTVLSIEKRQGERVRGSDLSEDVILTLAPLDRMNVELEVSEEHVADLQVGASAEVRIRPLQDLSVPGEISSIATTATVHNKGQLNELTRFKVNVLLRDIPERLRPGMTAEVQLIVRSKDNAVQVPYEAVSSRPASSLRPENLTAIARPDNPKTAPSEDPTRPIFVVFVLDEGRVTARPVATGIVNERSLEVVSGLTEGEVVVSGPFEAVSKTLQEGTPVDSSPIPVASPPVVSPTDAASFAAEQPR